MALKFKTLKADKSNYGNKRDTSDIKYIVIHYTGNKNDKAISNAKYFQGKNRHASAHLFVDGGEYIYRSVPDDYIAWSVGGLYSTKNGAGTYYKKCTNANSISIEMCNSVGSVPKKVYNQTVELTKYLMAKYNISESHVIRHFDCNGKTCPAPWATKDNSKWLKFKKDIKKTTSTSTTTTVTSSTTTSTKKTFKVGDANIKVKATKDCPIRKSKAASSKQLGTLKKGVKTTVLYVSKNAAGNLWGSVDYGENVGYIYLGNVEVI